LQAAAARSGAILGHDFCAISLSDLLTPWEQIEKRVHAAGAGDFVIAFYNPVSQRRRTQLATARDILMTYRGGDVPVILASNLGRLDEAILHRTLASLDIDEVDMLTTVMVGASTSRQLDLGRGNAVYTPRGYARHLDADDPAVEESS
jgi:cobalt-precorrin 5A hydrolase/precorrin-3B C17-methyltransferase